MALSPSTIRLEATSVLFSDIRDCHDLTHGGMGVLQHLSWSSHGIAPYVTAVDPPERRGRGWAATWPRDRGLLPPLLLLHYVLASPGVEVQAIQEGGGQGSDHRPVIAGLALLP